ncbi:MAG: response regulator [Deltaproteobacteria bacterium]|nr:response regulator [Deltaproteobacteria bacterium]
MKKRILFVDDEPNMLEGLQRMLRGMREEWEMQFAASGPEALALMDQGPFDVVVSDMRMPNMNGAQLLAEVMRRYPQTVRIILSGHSDSEFTLKSVRAAHQYLAKPCDPEQLKSVVIRACALRNVLADDGLKEMISSIESLPSLPSLYMEITEELRSPSSSLQKVGKVISKDIAMTAKVLQLVNSAFFGLQRHVSNPLQAVNLLGLDTIKALVLSVQIFSQFQEGKLSGLSLESLSQHSFLTGILAKTIAQMETSDKLLIDDSFMAGLLHDLGKPVLSMNFPERYAEVQNMAREKNIPSWEVEKDLFRASHAEVGAYLTGWWGLPDPIVEGIAYHHSPGRHAAQQLITPFLAVHVANTWEKQGAGPGGNGNPMDIDMECLTKLNFTDRLSVWHEKCQQILSKGENDGG